MMHAYTIEPCFQLNPDHRAQMRQAILDVEVAASAQGNPAGYRIFDAYITTTAPTPTAACNGYIIATLPSVPRQRSTPKRQGWWRRRRAR